MSVTDGVRADGAPPADPRGGESELAREGSGRDGYGAARSMSAEAAFDRTPPQDVAAEQCVLGGMLLSKDAIADVVEVLRSHDFYRPNHSVIFEAVLDLYGRGEPADPITVAAALADSGDLPRVGGAAYLHTLIASVPTAANAAYYAKIVSDRAVLRRLVEAGTRVVQLGYGAAAGGGRDIDDVVDLAQQAIYDVTERRVSEDFAVLAEMLQPTLDEIEAVGSQGGVMTGVPTGFTDLDRLLNGLHAGQLIVVAGRPGLGKALALDTPLPTPTGWTTMAEVEAGDRLLGADGRPTTVLRAFDVMLGRPCYEVEFSDGTRIVCDGDHLWQTTGSASGRCPAGVATAAPGLAAPGVGPGLAAGTPWSGARSAPVTTAQIAASLRHPVDGRLNHAVANCRPLSLPYRDDLPVPPYALGVWLAGGGTGTHIPLPYLRAAEPQRRALLAGLLDTRGTVSPLGEVRLTTGARRLAEDARELLVSLGYHCSASPAPAPTPGPAPGGSTPYAVDFAATDEVFGLPAKRTVHRLRRGRAGATPARYIVAVRPVPSVPVRCVTVDSPEHLYLAGRAMIPTHNSTAAMDFARSASVRNNLASAIFSLEMSKVEIVMRLLSAEARVPLHVLRSGQLSDDDWTKLARRMGEISEAPLFVDDTPNMTLMEIRAKARRLRQRHDLKLVIVDYLQLMTSPKRVESRQQEVAELSRGLKLLAKEVECPVVAVSQLNRGPEQRNDKRPQLSDLRESGCVTADTTLLRADTGAPVTFEAMLRDGFDGISVWSMDESHRLVARPVTNVFPSGVKTVHRLILASGRTVKASANHPFRAPSGWVELGALRPGDRIAVPRRIPAPLGAGLGWSPPRIRLLAERIGAGCGPGGTPRRGERADHDAGADHGWLAELGVDGRRCDERRVPDALYSADDDEITPLLRHLWTLGGCAPAPDPSGAAPGATAGYRTCSSALAGALVHLLARLGVVARLERVPTGGPAGPSYHVVPATDADARRLLGRPGGAGAGAAPDGTPAPVTGDVFWDPVVAVEELGELPVYDATVKGTHTFIADGIVAHNSIEQDADVVILLHRDDYYDKESPRAGEADFIVAKHRNGPTDTITVAAQLHLSRFVDMAVV